MINVKRHSVPCLLAFNGHLVVFFFCGGVGVDISPNGSVRERVVFSLFHLLHSMNGGTADGEGVVDVSTKDFPSIHSVHSQDPTVADLLQQAAEAEGVVQQQAGILLEQGLVKLCFIKMIKQPKTFLMFNVVFQLLWKE